MAQAELQFGHNEKLMRIAQEIVVDQLQEIAAKRLATGRGENYVDVLDGKTAEEKTGIVTPDGRGMTIFSPSDKYGYVCSSFNPVTNMISVVSHKIVATVKQTSPFCPECRGNAGQQPGLEDPERYWKDRGLQCQPVSLSQHPRLPTKFRKTLAVLFRSETRLWADRIVRCRSQREVVTRGSKNGSR
jgi:hypothetical protein